MLISRNLHMKSSEVSIKTRSTPASLSFKGQATKHTTVKWSIVSKFQCHSLTQTIFEMTQLILKCHVRDMTSVDQFLDWTLLLRMSCIPRKTPCIKRAPTLCASLTVDNSIDVRNKMKCFIVDALPVSLTLELSRTNKQKKCI